MQLWESENTQNWLRYETFYYFCEFKVFRHEERERDTISFYTDFFIWPHHVRHIA